MVAHGSLGDDQHDTETRDVNFQRNTSGVREGHGRTSTVALLAAVLAWPLLTPTLQAQPSYQQLTTLFAEWRAFERPPTRDGAPDYTAASMARKHTELRGWQSRLRAIDTTGWTTEQQIDWHLVRAEMNGFDFYVRVLKPWERDPAYYATVWPDQSDTPDHEGPTNHAAIELWQYTFPLDAAAQARLHNELRTIPPLLQQAKTNLTGNARDLWIAGTGSVRNQIRDLDDLATRVGSLPRLVSAIRDARRATVDFVSWLEQQAPSKTGPSGMGKALFSYHRPQPA